MSPLFPLAIAEERSVNIAWPTSGFGDGDYIYAFQKIIMPIAYEFAPDLVISQSSSPLRILANNQSLLDLTLPKVISLVNAMFLLPLMDT